HAQRVSDLPLTRASGCAILRCDMKRMGVVLFAALVGTGAGCATPWQGVLDGMNAGTIKTEVSSEQHDFARAAPPGFQPSPANRWILFIYDPKQDAKADAAFRRLSRTCFMHSLPPEENLAEGDPQAGRPRHAAICAFERVP